MEKINSFVHLDSLYWLILQNNLEYSNKAIQAIPQDVTYGENLVKDNSIAPSAKRRSKHA